MSVADDLALLPPEVADLAVLEANGEVRWRLGDAERAVNAMADAGFVILGLDLREYDDADRFFEVPWSVFEPGGRNDVEGGRSAALAALARPTPPGDAVLISYRPA